MRLRRHARSVVDVSKGGDGKWRLEKNSRCSSFRCELHVVAIFPFVPRYLQVVRSSLGGQSSTDMITVEKIPSDGHRTRRTSSLSKWAIRAAVVAILALGCLLLDKINVNTSLQESCQRFNLPSLRSLNLR